MIQTNEKNSYVCVFDPIPYFGGSKVASASYLEELQKKGLDIELFTQDPQSWINQDFNVVEFSEHSRLATKEYGVGYYLKNAVLTLQYLAYVVFLSLKRRQRPSLFVGVSGPGIDLSLYPVALLLGRPIVQLVHGPIGNSRLITFFLNLARVVGFLSSEKKQVNELVSNEAQVPHLIEFKNGITQQAWPIACNNDFKEPKIFWAASLLKWKGLDFFLDALDQVNKNIPVQATVAYIKPEKTTHPVSQAPAARAYLNTYEKPAKLSELRARHNIFISSSKNEPFGLSILEALATGLCVIIPRDGAYWDNTLIDGHNCLKYQANSVESLENIINMLSKNMNLARSIAENGSKVASEYRASESYKSLVSASALLVNENLSEFGHEIV